MGYKPFFTLFFIKRKMYTFHIINLYHYNRDMQYQIKFFLYPNI